MSRSHLGCQRNKKSQLWYSTEFQLFLAQLISFGFVFGNQAHHPCPAGDLHFTVELLDSEVGVPVRGHSIFWVVCENPSFQNGMLCQKIPHDRSNDVIDYIVDYVFFVVPNHVSGDADEFRLVAGYAVSSVGAFTVPEEFQSLFEGFTCFHNVLSVFEKLI